MRGMKMSSWASMLFLGLIVLGMWEVRVARAQLSAAQCKQERWLAVTACKAIIHSGNPSPECCERARVSHVECICPSVTRWMVAMIDVNRAIRLIEGCGRRLPRHFKCGSLTTP